AQLEHLQDFDRFYYLQRTDGLNFIQSLEGNSLAELARRNSTSFGTMDIIFNTADLNFDPATPDGVLDPTDPNSAVIMTQPDGTKLFFDPLHTGKNIVFNGGPGTDPSKPDTGGDTPHRHGGDDARAGDHRHATDPAAP